MVFARVRLVRCVGRRQADRALPRTDSVCGAGVLSQARQLSHSGGKARFGRARAGAARSDARSTRLRSFAVAPRRVEPAREPRSWLDAGHTVRLSVIPGKKGIYLVSPTVSLYARRPTSSEIGRAHV